MSLARDIHKKITLAIYDHKCMTRKANKMWNSLKEIEKTLDSLGKGKNIKSK